MPLLIFLWRGGVLKLENNTKTVMEMIFVAAHLSLSIHSFKNQTLNWKKPKPQPPLIF
jgi:hypothetical protein